MHLNIFLSFCLWLLLQEFINEELKWHSGPIAEGYILLLTLPHGRISIKDAVFLSGNLIHILKVTKDCYPVVWPVTWLQNYNQ